jgi:hypothetical protein
MNWMSGISGVPQDSLTKIVTRGKDAIMVLVVTNIFDLPLVVIEVA